MKTYVLREKMFITGILGRLIAIVMLMLFVTTSTWASQHDFFGPPSEFIMQMVDS